MSREFYVNDAGRQMDILAVSVWMRYLEHLGATVPFPEDGYRGDYVKDIAARLQELAWATTTSAAGSTDR